MKKNEISLLENAKEATNIISASLENAVIAHSGDSSLEVKTDSDGKEYVSATFKLSAPTKNRTEIVVNDVAIAQSLERMKRQLALGEVAQFALCKELYNFADSDASKLGFDSTNDMASAVFGLGKSTIANYRRIGEYFISDDLTLKGAIPKDTPISMLNQLLSMVVKEDENGVADIRNIEALFKYGILTPYMKQKDYKKVITTLKGIETGKELKDMSDDEVKAFKETLVNTLNPSKEEKKEGKSEEKKEGKSEEKKEEKKEEESNDPQVIIGQSMSIVKKLEENFNKLALTEEQTTLISTWLDNIYSTLGELLG